MKTTDAPVDTPWLTTIDAARYLRFSPQAIRQACAEGKLRHVQPGGMRGKILTRREWLDAWVEQSTFGG
ncbi:MAG: helix-turn-helix domain-containing protein [Vicinamibacterales bacterium]